MILRISIRSLICYSLLMISALNAHNPLAIEESYAMKIKRWMGYVLPVAKIAIGAGCVTASYIDNRIEMENGFNNYIQNFNPKTLGAGALLSAAKFWAPMVGGTWLMLNGFRDIYNNCIKNKTITPAPIDDILENDQVNS